MAWNAEGLSFDRSDAQDALKTKDARSGAPALLEPEVRVNFADTALWLPALTLDANGKAETEIRFPQSLTTWRLHGYALTKSTQVGDATNEVTTTKNLLVRLEEAETGQRGFLLTGRVEYLSSYEAALRAAPADLDELSALIRGDETNAPAGGFGSNPRGPGGQAAALVGWKAWACWRAALRTTSTTCWWASWATPV